LIVPRWLVLLGLAACVPGPASSAGGGTLSGTMPGLTLPASAPAAERPVGVVNAPPASAPVDPPPASQPAPAAEAAAKPAAVERVVIYGAAWCKACRAAKAYLERRRISYLWRDLDEELPAREELIAKMVEARYPYYDGMIPVISIDQVLLIGFNEGDLARILYEAKISARSK
jgi:glutaredoxin